MAGIGAMLRLTTFSMALLVVALSVTLMVSAQQQACDADCHLNGICTDGACQCDAPWTGSDCSRLVLGAANDEGAYGLQQNHASWGGNVIFFQGIWHLFVTEINGTGLSQWQSHSQVVHATSASSTGPFTRQDVAIGVRSHNPQVVLATDADGSTMLVLFHIYPGSEESKPRGRDSVGSGTSVVHTAASPYGPWTPMTIGVGCNNPAPMQHTNGTWFLLCHPGGEGITLHRADTLNGTWTQVATLPDAAQDIGTREDPFLWIDNRGNWHAIGHSWAHRMTTDCEKSFVSWQSYSRDGVSWTTSTQAPFDHEVKFSNGTVTYPATLERPKLLLQGGIPTVLYQGVTRCSNCTTWCSACKTASGFDNTYTLARPLG